MEEDQIVTLEKSFSATRDEVAILKGGFQVVQRDLVSLTSSIEKLVARFEDSRKVNWPMIALLVGLVPLLIAGLTFFTSSYTNSAIAPLTSQIAQLQSNENVLIAQVKDIATIQASRGRDISALAATSTTNSGLLERVIHDERDNDAKIMASNAADANSKVDREQLNNRMQKLESIVSIEMADRKEQAAGVRVQLSEVEEQFHSVSNLENLRAAQQQRFNTQLWEKAYPGERYPDITFFPTSIFQGPGGSATIPSR